MEENLTLMRALEVWRSRVIDCLERLQEPEDVRKAADAEDARCRAENQGRQQLNRDLRRGSIAG